MQDFTLVIPTYNRPKQLRALLSYLSTRALQSRVLVLESSEAKPRVANRKIIEQAKLKLDYAEFASETHPFDKFREGVHKVTTQFCALCADDDLIVPDGVNRELNEIVAISKATGRSPRLEVEAQSDVQLVLEQDPCLHDVSAKQARLGALRTRRGWG
jgi:glycosyltransferase domain-containing protein